LHNEARQRTWERFYQRSGYTLLSKALLLIIVQFLQLVLAFFSASIRHPRESFTLWLLYQPY
jgi:hypothetical protein